MKKLSLFFFLTLNLFVTAQNHQYQKIYKPANKINVPTIGTSLDSGCIVATSLGTSAFSLLNFNLTKFDTRGLIEWSKTYGANHNDIGYNPIQLTNHEYLI